MRPPVSPRGSGLLPVVAVSVQPTADAALRPDRATSLGRQAPSTTRAQLTAGRRIEVEYTLHRARPHYLYQLYRLSAGSQANHNSTSPTPGPCLLVVLVAAPARLPAALEQAGSARADGNFVPGANLGSARGTMFPPSGKFVPRRLMSCVRGTLFPRAGAKLSLQPLPAGGKNVACARPRSARSTLFPRRGKNVERDAGDSSLSTLFPGSDGLGPR